MANNSGRTRQRGFTLIELMVVVGIVGVLASVAIPTYQRLILRSKTAERTTVMVRIKTQVQDMYLRLGSAIDPSKHAGTTSLPSGWNPAYVAGETPNVLKLPMVTSAAALPVWAEYFSNSTGTRNSLDDEISGGVYYLYQFQVEEGPVNRITVWAMGDLDGDGAVSLKTLQWDRVNGVYQISYEDPLPGAEDPITF